MKQKLLTKRNALILAVLLLAVILFVLWGASAAVQVEAMELTAQATEISFTEDGTIALTDYYSIYAPTSAKVTAVYVQVDDAVTAGTVLAQLDTTDLQRELSQHSQNIAAYQAQISDAEQGERNTKDEYQALLNQLEAQRAQIEAEITLTDTAYVNQTLPEENLNILQASIAQCESEIAYYQDLLERQTVLYDAGALARVELEQTQLQLDALQTALAQYQQQKSAAEQELERIAEKYGSSSGVNSLTEQARNEQYQAMLAAVDAQILSAQENAAKDYAGSTLAYYEAMIEIEQSTLAMLQDAIDDCTITAPVDGIVYELPIQNSDSVYQQSIVCVLKPKSSYQIESYVSTKDVNALQTGGAVELVQYHRDGELRYAAQIDYIADWAQERVSALGLIEHKVKVLITPLVELEHAGEGYDFDVEYVYFQSDAALVVPKSAVFEYGNEHYVFLIEDNVAVMTRVELGASSTTQYVVTSGLSQGDILVKYSSTEGLADGVKLKYSLDT